jgi:DNA-binding MarR family transcriptional regulator
MASHELLDAVNLQEVRTTNDVAERLHIDARDAARQLRRAAREGLLIEETNLSASLAEDERQYWMLTHKGRELWDQLDSLRAR